MSTIPYQQVSKSAFATATIPDGYSGDYARVRVALIGNRIVYVASCGYFGAGLPDAIDQREALWLINNHPSSRARSIQEMKS